MAYSCCRRQDRVDSSCKGKPRACTRRAKEPWTKQISIGVTMGIDLSFSVIKIAAVGAGSFLFAFLLTPFLLKILYANKLWRKEVRKEALGGGAVPIFQKFHEEGEIKTPRFGGILIWLIPPALAFGFWILDFLNIPWFEKLNFLNRSQTWLPLATLLAASAIGFLDDI